MEEILLYYALKYQGDYFLIRNAIKSYEKVDQQYFHMLKQTLRSRYTTIVSDDYPSCLKSIQNPPFVLFYYGDLNILKQKTISIVGTRQPSEYGKTMAVSISRYVSDHNIVVVSGMAKGIDTYSHIGAMGEGKKTVAVLGSGIDYCYPQSNRGIYFQLIKDHLVISEYPGDTRPQKNYFPARNRIVCGLGEKLIVVEAKKQSGTMISVGYALDQGKEIICVPGRFTDKIGCNYLINQGAKILLELEELL